MLNTLSASHATRRQGTSACQHGRLDRSGGDVCADGRLCAAHLVGVLVGYHGTSHILRHLRHRARYGRLLFGDEGGVLHFLRSFESHEFICLSPGKKHRRTFPFLFSGRSLPFRTVFLFALKRTRTLLAIRGNGDLYIKLVSLGHI